MSEPVKQGNCWGPIVRTAWKRLYASRLPTLNHSFDSGWYSITCQEIWNRTNSLRIILRLSEPPNFRHHCRSLFQSLWPCLPQQMLCLNEKIGNEHQHEENWLFYQSIKVSAGQQRDSRMLPQEGGLSRVLPIRQQKVPARTNLSNVHFPKILREPLFPFLWWLQSIWIKVTE